MLKASDAKPEAWETWKVKIERRRCGARIDPFFSKRATWTIEDVSASWAGDLAAGA